MHKWTLLFMLTLICIPPQDVDARRRGRSKVVGYIDLHAHHFAHLAHNGQWFEGRNDDRPRRTPIWSNIQHQAMHTTWLKKAHREGLKIMLVSIVNYEPLCHILDVARRFLKPSLRRKLKSRMWNKDKKLTKRCADMRAVWHQINAVKRFAHKHRSWFRIVRSPQEARLAIRQGKLAAILHLEVSNLMDPTYGPWRTQLKKLVQAGVRSIQPVHEMDNRFGGAQLHAMPFKIFEALKSRKKYGDAFAKKAIKGIRRGYRTDRHGRNIFGLTRQGKDLIREMMKHRLLIDVAHLSMRGIRDTYNIVRRNRYYPMFASHAWIKETTVAKLNRSGEDPTSKSKIMAHHNAISRTEIDLIMRTGGMIGLRPGNKEQVGYRPRNTSKAVANTCHGSTRSFAQMYNYTHFGLGANVGIGSDLNGFIPMTVPRFGQYACGGSYLAKCIGKHGPAHAVIKRVKPMLITGGIIIGAPLVKFLLAPAALGVASLGIKAGLFATIGLPILLKKIQQAKDEKSFTCNALLGEMDYQKHKQRNTATGRTFDNIGFSHIGVLGEFFLDLKRVGADINNLRHSAENFLQMWERIHANNRSPRPGAKKPRGTLLRVKGLYARSLLPSTVCPPRQTRLGLKNGRAICWQLKPKPTILARKCRSWGGNRMIKAGYCVKSMGGWYLARKLRGKGAPNSSGVSCPGRRHQMGKKYGKPLCLAKAPLTFIQTKHCGRWRGSLSILSGHCTKDMRGWYLVRKLKGKGAPTPRNTGGVKCPGRRPLLGVKYGKAICWARPPLRFIAASHCGRWRGSTSIKAGFCTKHQGSWYLARQIKNAGVPKPSTPTCPGRRHFLGVKNGKAICWARPPLRFIKSKRCGKWRGSTSIKSGFCAKSKGSWYLARKLK
ncbi:MAG TPA: hypothetical protein DCE42_12515 [Myxococcales bacterium]|nr:hypothetical protein [Myxococcales bacterium]